jgi:hypothetical protein
MKNKLAEIANKWRFLLFFVCFIKNSPIFASCNDNYFIVMSYLVSVLVSVRKPLLFVDRREKTAFSAKHYLCFTRQAFIHSIFSGLLRIMSSQGRVIPIYSYHLVSFFIIIMSISINKCLIYIKEYRFMQKGCLTRKINLHLFPVLTFIN